MEIRSSEPSFANKRPAERPLHRKNSSTVVGRRGPLNIYSSNERSDQRRPFHVLFKDGGIFRALRLVACGGKAAKCGAPSSRRESRSETPQKTMTGRSERGPSSIGKAPKNPLSAMMTSAGKSRKTSRRPVCAPNRVDEHAPPYRSATFRPLEVCSYFGERRSDVA